MSDLLSEEPRLFPSSPALLRRPAVNASRLAWIVFATLNAGINETQFPEPMCLLVSTELWNNQFPETEILELPVSRRMRCLVYMASREKSVHFNEQEREMKQMKENNETETIIVSSVPSNVLN